MGEGLGAKLRAIRQQWRLSLREVEKRSLRVAQERGSESYQISASWLDRLEREHHELTVNKLIALADIYNLTAERLIREVYPEKDASAILSQLAGLSLAGTSKDPGIGTGSRFELPRELLARIPLGP